MMMLRVRVVTVPQSEASIMLHTVIWKNAPCVVDKRYRAGTSSNSAFQNQKVVVESLRSRSSPISLCDTLKRRGVLVRLTAQGVSSAMIGIAMNTHDSDFHPFACTKGNTTKFQFAVGRDGSLNTKCLHSSALLKVEYSA